MTSAFPDVKPLHAALAAAALLVCGLAFWFGRATSGDGPVRPTVQPLRAVGRGITLPRLSQAAPLPGLASPAAVVPAAAVPAPAVAPTPALPVRLPPPSRSRPTKPVVIVGSG